uniref:Uncharacterized protein n=1 Tax=Leptobrachium leishanense TaxID=445787 RepID=A0A8C5N3I9_9ANUR
MGELPALLSDLAWTCQQLEQIKAKQTKDHEQVAKSFEKTMLSILEKEQAILHHVESESQRLRDRLYDIKKRNDLALQDGVTEINSLVQEIVGISSQLKQALGTSNDSDAVIRKIKERVSNIFLKRKSINVSLRKVFFIPHPLTLPTLGDIRYEEQSLGFSIPCPSTKIPTGCVEDGNPVFLSDEKPPWEETSESSTDPRNVRVEMSEEGRDGDSGLTGTWSYPKAQKVISCYKPTMTFSPLEKAVKEVELDRSQQPTNKTRMHNPAKQQSLCAQIKGNSRALSAGEGNETPRTFLVASRAAPKEFPQMKRSRLFVKKLPIIRNSNLSSAVESCVVRPASQQVTTSPGLRKGHQLHRPSPGPTTKSTLAGLQADSWSMDENIKLHDKRSSTPSKPSEPVSQMSCDDINSNGEESTVSQDQDTIFRATTAYVVEDQSDCSEHTLEEEENSADRDPRTFREMAIRDSRMPSAKINAGVDPSARWQNETDSSICEDQASRSSMDFQDRDTDDSPVIDPIMTPSLTTNYLRSHKAGSEASYGPTRSVSPAESVTSTCTFVIESDREKETGGTTHPTRPFSQSLSRSTKKVLPVISSSSRRCETQSPHQLSKSKNSSHARSCPQNAIPNVRNQPFRHTSAWKPIPKSSSMPYIERIPRQARSSTKHHKPSASERRDSVSSSSSCWSNPRSLASSVPSGARREVQVRERPGPNRKKSPRAPHHLPNKRFSKSESNLVHFPPEDGSPDKLVKQFGKFGSGRAELNLPHGIHSSTSGSLYIVDYGNRRLQVMDAKGKVLQQIALRTKNYFDVAVNSRGLIALTNSTDRIMEVYNRHGRFLQAISRNWGAPRGITANHQDEFIVADMKLGTLWALTLDSSSGRLKESTVVPGFNKPYLVNCNSQGLLVISERGFDGGCCLKVLREDWQIVKVLGLKGNPGPTLSNPWGVCIDSEGGVLVADWGKCHSIVYFPPAKPARCIVTEGLSSPRGLALWQDRLLLVADSMHSCIKVFQYQ